MSHHVCIFCGEPFSEYGHSAEPIAHGRCCNLCNTRVVIPAKLREQRMQAIAAERQNAKASVDTGG